MDDLADRNLAVFDRGDVAAQFPAGGDLGEHEALATVAAQVRGEPVLDLGVGAGRTTWYLSLLTEQYVGLDAAPRMVERCRAHHPHADVRVGDARDLGAFADASQALVLFSANGLDAVGHADRALVLAEMARVVRPDGYVLYSTHNLHGGSYGERPWQWHRPHEPGPATLPEAARVAGGAVRTALAHPGRQARALRGYAAHRRERAVRDGWGTGPLRMHEFSLVVHFASAEWVERELAAAGLELVRLLTMDGAPVDPAGPETHTHYFHVLARRA